MESGTETREIILLLNEAKLSGDPSEKQQYLNNVFERVYKKERWSDLASELYPTLLEFETDRAPTIRKFVAELIEDVIKRAQKPLPLLSLSLQTLARLIADETPNVVKRAILCASNITRRTLDVVSRSLEDMNETKLVWNNFNNLNDRVLSQMATSKNDGVIATCIKFLETIALAFSSAESSRSDSFSLDNIPANHPILSSSTLKEVGEKYLGILINSLGANLSSTSLIALVGSITNLAKQRPVFLPMVIPALITARKQIPSTVSSSQLQSIHHSFKVSLLALLKIRSSVVLGWSDAVVEALSILGARDQAVSLQAKLQNAVDPQKRTSTSTHQPAPKRQKEEEPVAPPTLNAVPTPLPPDTFAKLQQLPFDLLLELIFESMANFPANNPLQPQLPVPPISSQLPVSAPVAVPRNDPRLDPRRDPRLSRGAAEAPAPVVQATTHSIVPQPSANMVADMPRPVVFPQSVAELPKLEPQSVPSPTIRPPAAAPVSTPVVPVAQPPPKEQAPVFVPFSQKLPPIPKYSPEECKAIGDKAIQRILASEKGAEISGKGALRKGALSLLATRLSLEDKLVDDLKAHILASFGTRKDLALSWIFRELTSEQEEEEDGIKREQRYEPIFMSILKNLKYQLDPKDRLFAFYVLEAPELPAQTFDTIREYCEDSERSIVGLSTLRDLIAMRPPYSDQSLEILLNYTSHPSEIVRSAAIRLVANRLYTGQEDQISVTIERHARILLESLVHVVQIDETPMVTDERLEQLPDDSQLAKTDVKSEQEKFSEEEAKCRVLLYFALCTRKEELVQGIADIYSRANSAVARKVIHQQSVGLIKALSLNSPALINLMNYAPRNSESLVLHILHIITDEVMPTPQIIAIAKNFYYKRVSDPRFLVPILPGLDKQEILALLPKLVTLPSNILINGINRLVQNQSSMTPAEVMIALHIIDTKDSATLKRIIEVTQFCLDQRTIFKQEVLAIVIQQLVDMQPIPPLFMRTVMQTVSRYPKLMNFIMNILSRLLLKQVWNDKRLWEGFVKCCKMTQPHCFPILVQLPKPQLENALQMEPELKNQLLQSGYQV
eukprot:TRINITY_DN4626_c0_g1_i1.p1 TRINITY_DN4626_c0_g1~~TRINITY_DN4626_c0_g1_i1.p1  ORF type:complete len:1070 (+),score=251.71 TRINITY_DN4626_c0_g1_i1:69-3278(+)